MQEQTIICKQPPDSDSRSARMEDENCRDVASTFVLSSFFGRKVFEKGIGANSCVRTIHCSPGTGRSSTIIA